MSVSKDNQCQAGRDSKPTVDKETAIGSRKMKVIDSQEISDAWNTLIALEQSKEPDLEKKKKHLLLFKVGKVLGDGTKLTQLTLGSRVKIFPIGFSGKKDVPCLPEGKFARLVVQKYHDKYHCDIDTLVCHVRNEVFIPQLRRIAAYVDRRCKRCLIRRRKFAEQQMGDLPTLDPKLVQLSKTF